MRIEFDTGNAGELLAVATLIEALRGDMPATIADQGRSAPLVPSPPAPVAAAPSPVGGSAPAAPVPPVPAAPVASVLATGVDVDAHGLPWDKRIHSDPPKKNSDSTWRSKRNLDAAVKTQVEAELRQVMAAPAAAPVAAAAPAAAPVAAAGGEEAAPLAGQPSNSDNTTVDAATAFGGAAATTVASAAPPVPPVVPTAPVAAAAVPAPPVAVATPPASPAAAGGLSFASLMVKITGLQTAGALTMDDTNAISQSLGITGVRDLMHRPDLLPAFDALLPVAG